MVAKQWNMSSKKRKCFWPDSLPCFQEIQLYDEHMLGSGMFDIATKLLTQRRKIENTFSVDSLNISLYTLNIEAKKWERSVW